MRTELPTQAQIIEELADRVASQIDLGKPVAFDNALEELIRYHKFLLGLSASTTPDGRAFSYAELSGLWMIAPHEEWIGQYRRLFEHAANRIPDDDHFIVSFAYAQGRLLQLPHDLQASKSVIQAVLNLYPAILFAVERWVTRRAISHSDHGERQKSNVVLAGSDMTAHAAAIRRLVGAWEGLFFASPAIERMGRQQGKSGVELWTTAQDAWEFLWPHLVNSARALTIAVWNNDEAGAELFREALLHWPEHIGFQLPEEPFLEFPEPLLPSLIHLPWERAKGKADTLGYEHSPSIGPLSLLKGLLERAHSDVVQLTASLLVHWSLAGKQTGHLGCRTARALLGGQAGEWQRATTTADGLLLRYLGLQMAGERFQDGTYGASLDGLIASLDNLSEKPQVSGRVYTPTTLTDREGLVSADVAVMAAFIDHSDSNRLAKRLRELAGSESKLPDSDGSLRNILHEIGRYKHVIDTQTPRLLEALDFLGSSTPEADLHQLRSLMETANIAIDEVRTKRLADREVDPKVIEEYRTAVDAALLDTTPRGFFKTAEIVASDDGDLGEILTFSYPTFKARLVTPPMDNVSSRDPQSLGKRVDEWAISRSGRLGGLEFSEVHITEDPTAVPFWTAIKPYADAVGEEPRILLPARFRSQFHRMMFDFGNSPLASLDIQKPALNRRSYLCRVEGIDVYISREDNHAAILMSGRKLTKILYGPVEAGQRVNVHFEPIGDVELAGDGPNERERLIVKFRQSFEWDDSPVFHIMLPEQPDENE